MKYLSLIFLVLFMSLSWQFTYNKKPLGDYIHIQLQDDLKKYFSSYIKKRVPAAKSIKVKKIWTQNTKDNKIKAYFEYSFEEPQNANTTLQGSALLKRTEPKGGKDLWKMEEVMFSKNNIVFEDGIEILND